MPERACPGCGRGLPPHHAAFVGEAEFNIWAQLGYCSFPCFHASAPAELLERFERDEEARRERDVREGHVQPRTSRRRVADEIPRASVLGRVLARGIDDIALRAGAFGVAAAIVGATRGRTTEYDAVGFEIGWRTASWLDRVVAAPELFLLLFVAGSFSYFALSQALWGTTPAKALFGYRVTTERGRRASAVRVGVREALFLFDAVFVGLVAFVCMSMSGQRQRVGDMIARTIVTRGSRQRLVPFAKALVLAIGWAALWGALAAWFFGAFSAPYSG